MLRFSTQSNREYNFKYKKFIGSIYVKIVILHFMLVEQPQMSRHCYFVSYSYNHFLKNGFKSIISPEIAEALIFLIKLDWFPNDPYLSSNTGTHPEIRKINCFPYIEFLQKVRTAEVTKLGVYEIDPTLFHLYNYFSWTKD